MKINKISLIGLGKLGLPLLSVFAKNGQEIIGYDIDQNKITKLKDDDLPIQEPYLKEYLTFGKNNIIYSDKMNEITNGVDVSIILVNTPSKNNGEFSNEYVFEAIDGICDSLNKTQNEDFLFILSSTVMPKTNFEIIERIETKTGRKLNKGFGLVYIPDLVALGTVINDFENPDVLIMGESENRYGDIAKKIYSKILKNNAPIVRMSLIECEITKVSLNAYITMKISFANFLGNICEKLNANSKNITSALGFDKRISPYYLKSGLAFGGTCFPRDTWAFIKMSENLDLNAVHIKATQKINEEQNNILFEKVSNYKNKSIGIIGLSFKSKTSVTTESPGYILYEKLKKLKYNVYTFDEFVTVDESRSLNDVINLSDVIVLTHNDTSLEKIKEMDIKNKLLINPWGLNL